MGVASLRPSAATEVGYIPDAPAPAAAPATAAAPVGETEPRAVRDAVTASLRGAAAAPKRRAAPTRTPLKLAAPVRLELPDLGLSARIAPVGVDADGALTVPANPDVVGWWRSGARPGEARGSVVIDGHVDSATEGLGVFARLRELEPGAAVVVESASGDARRYRVTGRRQFPKAALPADTVFSQDVAERLVLVTCGGRFNRDEGSYTDNVVVFAVPDGDLASR